jgi:hypothetical protein
VLRAIVNITVKQNPTQAFPGRNGTLIFNFVNDLEAEDNWKDLTNKGKMVLPKNVYVRNQYNNSVQLAGTNVNLGGFSSNPPIFLRGDAVTIQAGYRYFDAGSNERTIVNPIFTGYIAKVSSKKPVTLDLEDNMWQLKQIPAPNIVFSFKTYTLESILTTLLQGTPFTVNHQTSTTLGVGINMGDFRTMNETVAEVLSRIRKDYHFESYFRGNELRCGPLVYLEEEAAQQTFVFQENIIEDELEYQRKDDITLSAIAYSVNRNASAVQTKDGHTKTKFERLEALVIYKNGAFTSTVKAAGAKADFAPNTEGERRTLYFWNVTSGAQLVALAQAELTKYYYSGFKGKFTTFMVPFVRQGDNAKILDPVLPERNGLYKIKSVQYKVGTGGLRQIIELDYLISPLDTNGNIVNS